MTLTALDKWYDYTKSHDRAALWDLLDPEAVFESPVVHTPQRGRDIAGWHLAPGRHGERGGGGADVSWRRGRVGGGRSEHGDAFEGREGWPP